MAAVEVPFAPLLRRVRRCQNQDPAAGRRTGMSAGHRHPLPREPKRLGRATLLSAPARRMPSLDDSFRWPAANRGSHWLECVTARKGVATGPRDGWLARLSCRIARDRWVAASRAGSRGIAADAEGDANEETEATSASPASAHSASSWPRRGLTTALVSTARLSSSHPVDYRRPLRAAARSAAWAAALAWPGADGHISERLTATGPGSRRCRCGRVRRSQGQGVSRFGDRQPGRHYVSRDRSSHTDNLRTGTIDHSSEDSRPPVCGDLGTYLGRSHLPLGRNKGRH